MTRDRAGVIGAACVASAGAWLLLRPESPDGAAAVVDLLVLPAVLFAEVRLLAGRSELTGRELVTFFGIGAAVSSLVVLVVQGAVWALFGTDALHAVGPVAEQLAVCLPVVFLAVTVGRRRSLGAADLALAGLATGLGFLVVHASVVTAARHAGPEYVSPLVAGWLRVPTTGDSAVVFFTGPAVTAALVGLAVGLASRLRPRVVGLAVVVATCALVTFEHALFDWHLRRFADSEAATTSGAVDAVRRLSLDGRLSLALLAVGLVALGRRRASRPVPAPDDEPEPEPDEPDAAAVDHLVGRLVASSAGDAVVAPATSERASDAGDGAPLGGTTPAGAWAVAGTALALGTGVAVTVLARTRHLGWLDSRAVAVAVCGVGLVYGVWSLAGSGDGGDATPTAVRRQGRRVRCLAAMASSALGVVVALLAEPAAPAPFHGGLLLDAVRGWGAHVGNVGFLLGLGGLAAPGGGPPLRSQAWFVALLPRRWRLGGPGGAGPLGDLDRPVRRWRLRRQPGGSGDPAPARRRRWWRLGRRAATDGLAPPDVAERVLVVAIEPRHRPSLARAEFTGATVKEAVKAALSQTGVDLAAASFQLVDPGQPARPGKPGSGRPARVRLAEATGDDPLLPPGRDSIVRETPVVVVVDVPLEADAEPPPTITVDLRVPPHPVARALACTLEPSSSGTARYRSNPYTVDGGEAVPSTGLRGDDAPAAGVPVGNGERLVAEHQGVPAAVTVYDSWPEQVVGVNRGLLELTRTTYEATVAELAEVGAEMEAGGRADPRVGDRMRQLETRLAYVAEAERLSASRSSAGQRVTAEDAFTTTALLDAAMSLDARYDEGHGRDAILAAADAAWRAHGGDGGGPDAYRAFLLGQTVAVGQLWAAGASTAQEIGSLLGWDHFEVPVPPR